MVNNDNSWFNMFFCNVVNVGRAMSTKTSIWIDGFFTTRKWENSGWFTIALLTSTRDVQ